MTDGQTGSYEIDPHQVRSASGELWQSGDDIARQVGTWQVVGGGQVGSDRAADIINRFIGTHASNAGSSAGNFQDIAGRSADAATAYVTADELGGTGVRTVESSMEQGS